MSRRSEGQLFVGRLSKSTRTGDLEDIFERYGRLNRCEIKYGAEMAYAFVDYEDRRDAEDAVKYENGREVCGSAIIVEWAKGNPRRPPLQAYDECYRCRRPGHWARDCPNDNHYGYRRPSRSGRYRSPSPYSKRRRSRSRSRSRSRERRRRTRSRSRSRTRRDRSRSRDRRRSRSREGSRKKISREKSRSHSKSKSRSRSKSKSKSASRSRSRSHSNPPSEKSNAGSDRLNGEDDANNGDRSPEHSRSKSRSRSPSGSKSPS